MKKFKYTKSSAAMHVVKTAVMVDKAKKTVHVGLTCDVCGEIQLPPIPYDHVQAFATLLLVVGAQLQTPEFVYVPAAPKGGLVDHTNVDKFDEVIDYQNMIHEVLIRSKSKASKADQS